ncbi:MAG: membrane dipeptidase [Candidatus Anstonellales archaeon]
MKYIDLHQDLIIRARQPWMLCYDDFSDNIIKNMNNQFSVIIAAIFPLNYTEAGVYELNAFREIIKQLMFYKKMRNKIKFNMLISLEGCYGLELDEIEALSDLGISSYGFTWNYGNAFSSGCSDKKDNGLSEIGSKAVSIIMDKHCLIDLAHLSRKSIMDILNEKIADKGRVFVSHTGIKEFFDKQRNIDMECANKVADNKGIVGIAISKNMVKDLNTFIKCIDAMIDNVGKNAVALGSDMYGIKLKDLIMPIKEANELKKLELKMRKNFSKAELYNIFFMNAHRFLKHAGLLNTDIG